MVSYHAILDHILDKYNVHAHMWEPKEGLDIHAAIEPDHRYMDIYGRFPFGWKHVVVVAHELGHQEQYDEWGLDKYQSYHKDPDLLLRKELDAWDRAEALLRSLKLWDYRADEFRDKCVRTYVAFLVDFKINPETAMEEWSITPEGYAA